MSRASNLVMLSALASCSAEPHVPPLTRYDGPRLADRMRQLYDTCAFDGPSVRCEQFHEFHRVTVEVGVDGDWKIRRVELNESAERCDYVTFDLVFAELVSPRELAALHVLRPLAFGFPDGFARFELGGLEVRILNSSRYPPKTHSRVELLWP